MTSSRTRSPHSPSLHMSRPWGPPPAPTRPHRLRAHRHIQAAGRITTAGVGPLGVGAGARHQAGMVRQLLQRRAGRWPLLILNSKPSLQSVRRGWQQHHHLNSLSPRPHSAHRLMAQRAAFTPSPAFPTTTTANSTAVLSAMEWVPPTIRWCGASTPTSRRRVGRRGTSSDAQVTCSARTPSTCAAASTTPSSKRASRAQPTHAQTPQTLRCHPSPRPHLRERGGVELHGGKTGRVGAL